MSGTPLEVERRFSDPKRLESGCESSEKGENRRGENVSHRREKESPHAGRNVAEAESPPRQLYVGELLPNGC